MAERLAGPDWADNSRTTGEHDTTTRRIAGPDTANGGTQKPNTGTSLTRPDETVSGNAIMTTDRSATKRATRSRNSLPIATTTMQETDEGERNKAGMAQLDGGIRNLLAVVTGCRIMLIVLDR